MVVVIIVRVYCDRYHPPSANPEHQRSWLYLAILNEKGHKQHPGLLSLQAAEVRGLMLSPPGFPL